MRQNRRRAPRRARRSSGSSPATVMYRGPIQPPVGDQVVTMHLSVTPLQVTTGATGISNGFVSTSVLTSATDWGTVSPNYGEVRILGMRVEYLPIIPESGSSAPVGFLAAPHANSFSTPSAPSSVANIPGRRYVSLGDPWVMEWRMSSIDEAGFQPTNAAYPNYGGVTWATDFGPASTTLGYYTVALLVQFRSQS